MEVIGVAENFGNLRHAMKRILITTFNRRSLLSALAIAGLSFSFAGQAWAEQHTAGVPALSSRPGAAYTVYLDFAGFNYTGDWNNKTPGNSAAYGDVAANGTFSGQHVSDIQKVWALVSGQYAAFNINVTTVDPATGVNAATDFARQNFYANTPNMMHTIFTSQFHDGANWYGPGLAGLSFAGSTNGTENYSGGHTNWIFSADSTYNEVGNTRFLAQGATHENGHGLGLIHQGDYTGNTLINDYSLGDSNASGGLTGPGTYGAIMGDGNFAQRLAFRVGDSNNGTPTHKQNDVALLLSTNTVANALAEGRTGGADLHLIDDGIGHTLATATPLAFNGDNVDFNLATGVIVPLSESNPLALGANNYTKDYFSFTLQSTALISLTAHNDSQFLTPGVADGMGALRSTLKIFNTSGGVIGTAVEDASTLFSTFSGTLSAGTYYAEIASFGGHEQISPDFNAAQYFDMGAYFVTGTGFTNAVPEPGTFGLLIVGAAMMLRRRRA